MLVSRVHCLTGVGGAEIHVFNNNIFQAEMQVLHMSNESQMMVQEMLKELHGDHYKIRESKTYRDSGHS